MILKLSHLYKHYLIFLYVLHASPVHFPLQMLFSSNDLAAISSPTLLHLAISFPIASSHVTSMYVIWLKKLRPRVNVIIFYSLFCFCFLVLFWYKVSSKRNLDKFLTYFVSDVEAETLQYIPIVKYPKETCILKRIMYEIYIQKRDLSVYWWDSMT